MIYAFDQCRLDLQTCTLHRADQVVHLRPKVFYVLAYLLAHRHRVVSKQELCEQVWGAQFISDSTLESTLSAVRRAIGDAGRGHRMIQTLHGRGYRLVVPVQEMGDADSAPSLAVTPATARPPEVPLLSAPLPLFSLSGPDLGGQGRAFAASADQVLGGMGALSGADVALQGDLTFFVGRQSELRLLQERWMQVQAGAGQVLLINGEAGIGKTALVIALHRHGTRVPMTWLGCRGLPDHQHSMFFPVTQVLLQMLPDHPDSLEVIKRQQLEALLAQATLPVAETVPLLAPLLGLPVPQATGDVLLAQQQRQQTLMALMALVLAWAERQPVVLLVEDLHWVDPSTLEWLSLLVEQAPLARLCLILTCRSPWQVPWAPRSYQTHITLQPLSSGQVAEMVRHLTQERPLPDAVLQQVIDATDGVPLFVEELTKMLLESGQFQTYADDTADRSVLAPLHIPPTLYDLLMARLDRLGDAKRIAQLGAVIGRSVPYALLRALAAMDEASLQQALRRLVEAELLYPRGISPHVTYSFKHALIRAAAYQSLRQGDRQQLHRQVAEVLAQLSPASPDCTPELLAHHYAEAGLPARAVVYLQQAGEHANTHAAYVEASRHLAAGLELLATLPDSPERDQQELAMLMTQGTVLMTLKGLASPEVELVCRRAYTLCQQVGDTAQRFSMLWGLWRFYFGRAAHRSAHDVGTLLLTLAQQQRDTTWLLLAHLAQGTALYFLGELVQARTHLERGFALSDPAEQYDLAVRYAVAPAVWCLAVSARVLWALGYADQALQRIHTAHHLAQELAHPQSLVTALYYGVTIHQQRRDARATAEWADTLRSLATEQQFAYFAATGRFFQGWALSMQGQVAEGMRHMRQGLTEAMATGAELVRPHFQTLLAEVAHQQGEHDMAMSLLAEALDVMQASGRQDYRAEAYRLQGELLLQSQIADTRAQDCLQRALDLARQQQAKSWELRAAMSLSRLWQRQGKQVAARQLLTDVYAWFSEGFDTADLRQAQALLATLM